jgi:hypothetical protein
LFFVNEEAVFAFLKKKAVSGGDSRFWRREPFLEKRTVSAFLEEEGHRL